MLLCDVAMRRCLSKQKEMKGADQPGPLLGEATELS
jgi:hypothetical protein